MFVLVILGQKCTLYCVFDSHCTCVLLSVEGWWFVHVQDSDEQGWAPASCLLPENREQFADIAVTGINSF